MLLRVIRLVFMILITVVTLLQFVGPLTDTAQGGPDPGLYIPMLVAMFIFGLFVISVDVLTPKKRLATVFGIYLGLIAGLVGALAVGALIEVVAKSWDLTGSRLGSVLGLIKLAIGIALCYLAISIVLTTKDDVRLVIPYVEFAKQVRGVRPLLLDSSALIDGRIDKFAQTGFLDAPLVVPQFVIDELQILADSGDRLKRARGRRGLDLVSTLQANPEVDISIDTTEVQHRGVDRMLLELAHEQGLRILTTDYNLNKVAQIQGVPVLNINELANTLRPEVIPGEHLTVEIVREGEAAGQGVGYLPDGTMVVVEDTADRVGQTITLSVTNALQTSAGRMIFGKFEAAGSIDELARTATHQPRATERPARRPDAATSARRNPRR